MREIKAIARPEPASFRPETSSRRLELAFGRPKLASRWLELASGMKNQSFERLTSFLEAPA